MRDVLANIMLPVIRPIYARVLLLYYTPQKYRTFTIVTQPMPELLLPLYECYLIDFTGSLVISLQGHYCRLNNTRGSYRASY